jgi:hypothetical protein
MTCGEETEKDCLAAIAPFRDQIEFREVRNVTPQIKALNLMLQSADTPYLVPLDADMILNDDAFERINRAIDKYSHDPNWHSILFPLWDTLTEQQILALKILRTEIMRAYPFVDSPTPDVEHFQRLTAAGYTCIQNYLQRPPIGKHVVKGKFFCYHKYRDVYMTLRKHSMEWDRGVFMGGSNIYEKSKAHFDFFLYKYLKTDDPDCLYCIAGMVDGLTAPPEEKSKTLERRPMRIKKSLAIDEYLRWYQQGSREIASSWV